MHDEKYSGSGLEQSQQTEMFEMGGGSAHLNSLSARQDIGPALISSIHAHTVDAKVATPGWDERPGFKLPGIDQRTSESPEPARDMRRPAKSGSIWSQYNVSFSRILEYNPGRTAWIVLSALTVAFGVGFGGGLASYQYLNQEAPPNAPPQQVNSSAHFRESGTQSIAKTDMLLRSTTSGAGSQTPNIQVPTVSLPRRALPASSGAAQLGAASSSGAKATEPASSISRPEIPEREAMVKPVPETRPTTIEGWIVREVRGEAMILQGPDGIRRVMRGDTVPGVGRIDSVVRWGSRWIVATTSGLIATP